MQARENALSDFIKHLSCGPVMELMLKLIKADDAVCNGEGAKGTIQVRTMRMASTSRQDATAPPIVWR